jgi:hypothetical protein
MEKNAGLDKVNYLNAAFMALSAALAYCFPFGLFLFVYAVLGPLHYLTEISWLHDKGYYTRSRGGVLFLLGASLAVTLLYLGWAPFLPRETMGWLTCLAFAGSFFLVRFPEKTAAWGGTLACGLGAVFLAGSGTFQSLFGIFLPTLLHVFLFTGLFILMGSLKARNLSGYLSLAVFGGLACSFFIFHPAHRGYDPGDYVRQNYGLLRPDGTGSSPFLTVNLAGARLLGLFDFRQGGRSAADYVRAVNGFFYGNPSALALMSFISFAYTYHYLNWFSKTSLIGWHRISRRRGGLILVLWALSLGLYGFNYAWGLKWLFFLSFTHVLLEFPLNHLTFLGILRELGHRGAFPAAGGKPLKTQ